MNDELRERILKSLLLLMKKQKDAEPEEYDKTYNLYLDVKWAGFPDDNLNPKKY